MIHSFSFVTTAKRAAKLQADLETKGVRQYLIDESIKYDISFPSDIVLSYERISDTKITIEGSTFTDVSSVFIELAKKISKKNRGTDIIYRYHFKNDSIVGGIKFVAGRNAGDFYFDERDSICDAMTDYLCAVHVSLERHDKVAIDGVVVSEYIGEERPIEENPPYVINTHRIYFGNEKIYLHLEFNSKEAVLGEKLTRFEESYEMYGLTNASWTKHGYVDMGLSTLQELINGDVADNFAKLVPFRFAQEISNIYSRKSS